MNDVVLRDLGSEDLEKVRIWRNSESVSKYMYTDGYISSEQQKQWYDLIKEDSKQKYWIISYQGKDIGLASITEISKTFDSCFWAFYLGDTTIRGGGIGSKVEYSVIEYVFGILGLNKLKCEVFVTNDKVIRMHEKFGFRREAYYRQHVLKNQEYLDVVGLGLLKAEWLQIRETIYKSIFDR
ncbi:MAG: UDP-4-amino-4,6-dideoxy-N-acetyl-beta-L-altrosamine N-acetyltransferase [Bacteroidetes bacterium]|nr:UDP-4-amino-4,6-dideoxy-N-acetyl-beta-L-altrosamine N-acetyltransferase [Bacteroidota bacterium]